MHSFLQYTLVLLFLSYLTHALPKTSNELETIMVTPHLGPTGTLRDFMPRTTAFTIAPTPTLVPLPASHCTDSLLCCQHVEPKVAEQASIMMKGFNIVLWGAEALVGIGCKAASLAEPHCAQSLACCQHADSFSGIVTLGCVDARFDEV